MLVTQIKGSTNYLDQMSEGGYQTDYNLQINSLVKALRLLLDLYLMIEEDRVENRAFLGSCKFPSYLA